jgi:hypothetical protein
MTCDDVDIVIRAGGADHGREFQVIEEVGQEQEVLAGG